MTVSTYTQPDNTAQVGAAYKTAIDGAVHVHHRISGAFACHQQDGNSPDAPDMTIVVDAGALVRAGLVPLEVAQQSTSTLSSPSGNPRHDVVYIDNATGAVGVATGAEAVSPTDPAIPAGKTAVARVRLTVGMTEITNADIDDLRVGGSAPEFTGPDVSDSPQLPGTAGIVPAPAPGDEGKFLRGDAIWAAVVDRVARDMAASAMALADANGVAGSVGAFLLADPFTSDTLAFKSGSNYSASNDWYTNEGVETATQSQTGGGANADLSSGGYVAQSFQVSVTDPVTAVEIKTGIGGGGAGVFDITIEADSAGAPSGTPLASATGKSLNNTSTVNKFTLNSPWTPTASTTYWLVIRRTVASAVSNFLDYQTSSGYASGNMRSTAIGNQPTYDLYFKVYQTPADTNAIWRPSPTTLLTANPLDVMFYALFDPVDSLTMGTDVIGKVSIADGSPEDFVTGTWTKVGTYGNYEIWRLDVDLSAKTGSTLEYSIETANNKAIRFKQAIGCVPLY